MIAAFASVLCGHTAPQVSLHPSWLAAYGDLNLVALRYESLKKYQSCICKPLPSVPTRKKKSCRSRTFPSLCWQKKHIKVSEIFLNDEIILFSKLGYFFQKCLFWSCGFQAACSPAAHFELLHTDFMVIAGFMIGFNVDLRLWTHEALPKKTVKFKTSLNTVRCSKGWIILVYVARLTLKGVLSWWPDQDSNSIREIFRFLFRFFFLSFPSHSPSLTFTQCHSYCNLLGSRVKTELTTFITLVKIFLGAKSKQSFM